ncbi:Uncharacterised protein [Acinetobacter baumannii]|nr:Uncharacterised protein [Acinetobacter baumannii]
MRDEVARAMTGVQLLDEDAFPGSAAGIGGARQAADQGAVGKPGQGPRLDGGGTDVGQRNLPEQLAEAVHLLVQQAGHRFRGAVAAGETGAAGDQHDLHAILGDPGRDLCADPV